jgi:hypothetical protein
MHIAFTLITAQVLGSIATILARAIAPDNIGPGPVFPDFSGYNLGDPLNGLKNAWFYIGLFSQIVICVGYFLFFRNVHFHWWTILIAGTTSETMISPFVFIVMGVWSHASLLSTFVEVSLYFLHRGRLLVIISWLDLFDVVSLFEWTGAIEYRDTMFPFSQK